MEVRSLVNWFFFKVLSLNVIFKFVEMADFLKLNGQKIKIHTKIMICDDESLTDKNYF